MKSSYSFPRYFFAILAYALLFSTCKKVTYNDAIPKVSLTSVSYYSPDSVLLQGKITDGGASSIEYAGFSLNTSPSFSILKNQVLLQGPGQNFSAVVYAAHDSTYFFKAFASNSYGYAVSNTIQMTIPVPGPVTAPCTLPGNTIDDNGISFVCSASGSSTLPTYGNYMVTINGLSEQVFICFSAVPVNGVYTCVNSSVSTLGSGQVIMYISNFSQYFINSGSNIYVAVNSSSGITTISFCPLTYVISGNTNGTISGKVSY